MTRPPLHRWTRALRVQRAVLLLFFLGVCAHALTDPDRLLTVEGGAVAGMLTGGWTTALFLAGPARLFGIRVGGWSIGAGPPARTWLRPRGSWQLRRFPLPVARPLLVGAERRTGTGTLLATMATAVAAVALAAGALALAGGPFGTTAALFCLAESSSAVLTFGMVHAATAAGPESVPEDGLTEVLTAAQRDIAEARRLLDALPPGPGAARVELTVLLGEGRYRELADRAAALTGATGEPAVRMLHARALAYLDERGEADDADRAAFRTLLRELRRAPRMVREGSDLPALRELADGHPGMAIDAARSAAAVGSAPLRRSMAQATLALAHHRAGHTEEARAALAKARSTGPATARLEFLAGLVDAPAAAG